MLRHFRCLCVALLVLAGQADGQQLGPGPSPRLTLGTTTNDNAPAGFVGEYISSSIPNGSAVSLTSGTQTNITSVSLTAGDWDCSGEVDFYPAGTTTVSQLQTGIGTTSATLPTRPAGGGLAIFQATLTTGQWQDVPISVVRESLATTTTVYLVAVGGFGTSTMTAGGFIGCRRMR